MDLPFAQRFAQRLALYVLPKQLIFIASFFFFLPAEPFSKLFFEQQ